MVKKYASGNNFGSGRPKKAGAVGKKKASAKGYAGEKIPKKQPKPPKKPLNAMQLYIAERSSSIRSADPNLVPARSHAMAKDEWDRMDPHHRQVWLNQEESLSNKYQKALERFEKRKTKYEQYHSDSEDGGKDEDDDDSDRPKKKNKGGVGLKPIRGPKPGIIEKFSKKDLKKKKKKEKDPNAPRKGLNPYMFFSQARVKEIRAADPMIQQKDALRAATAQWNGMTEAEKKTIFRYGYKR